MFYATKNTLGIGLVLLFAALFTIGCADVPSADEADLFVSTFNPGVCQALSTPTCNGTCPRTIGYWKNHTEMWKGGFSPDDVFPYPLNNAQGMTYLQVLRKANAKDMTLQLAAQMIASNLNVANGACAPVALITDICFSKRFLNDHFGNDPRGELRDQAEYWKDQFDDFNNSGSCH